MNHNIPNNRISLLQNGEAYFPAVEAALDRAEHEIYFAVIDAHWATVGSSNLDPFSLLLSLEANVVVVDEDFAKELKQSLDEAIRKGARRIFVNSWSTQSFRLRLTSWLSYGLVRFLKGMAGYAPGKTSGATRAIRTSPSGSNKLWKR